MNENYNENIPMEIETAEIIAEAEDMMQETAEAAEETIVEAAQNLCQKCGMELMEDQQFCPRCGTQKGQAPVLICSKCGRTLEPDVAFCPGCGQKAGTPAKASFQLLEKYKGLSKPLQTIIPAAAALLVVLAIVLGVVLGNAGKDFRKMFPDLVGKKYVTFATDGSWMRIDSNPNNVDSDDYTDYTTMLAADDAVKATNQKLGFSTALDNKMDHTTWSMGLQTETVKGYQVSWTYHPDKGLEALYEVK